MTNDEGNPNDEQQKSWRTPFRRSEEHTSELQSPCNLVCRLLLEKKKYRRYQPHSYKMIPIATSILALAQQIIHESASYSEVFIWYSITVITFSRSSTSNRVGQLL